MKLINHRKLLDKLFFVLVVDLVFDYLFVFDLLLGMRTGWKIAVFADDALDSAICQPMSVKTIKNGKHV